MQLPFCPPRSWPNCHPRAVSFVIQFFLVGASSTLAASALAADTTSASRGPSADLPIVHDAWIAYLAALAAMVAAGSGLLAAVAVIRLQAFSTSLAAIESATAETFRRVARLDEYVRLTSEAFLADRWSEYFSIVEKLTVQEQNSLAEDSRYVESSSYLALLLRRGRKVEIKQRRLRSALKTGLLLTMALAAFAVFALPAGRWASNRTLTAVWLVTGVLLSILFAFFARLTLTAMRNP